MLVGNSPVTSLRWLTESQQSKLANVLVQACQSVIDQWRCGTDSQAFEISVLPASSLASTARTCFEVTSDAGRLLTIRLGTDSLRQLLNLPIGSIVPMGEANTLLSEMELGFVEAVAWQIVPSILAPGLRIRLQARFDEDNVVKHSRQIFDLTSGRNTGCGCLILEGQLVDQLLPRIRHKGGVAPVSRRQAVGGESVLLKAHVGQVEVSFRSLQSLVPGDVLMLQAPISEPISLRSETGQLVAAGNLGQQDQRRVVRLSSTAANGQAGRTNVVKRSIQ